MQNRTNLKTPKTSTKAFRFAISLLLCSTLVTQTVYAYLTAIGDGTNGQTFSQPIGAAQFYKPTGEYYFAQGGQVATNDTYQVCYGNYRTPGTAPTLQPLAPSSSELYQLNGLSFLSVINQTPGLDQTSPTILIGSGVNGYQNLAALTKTYNDSPVTIPATGDFEDAAGENTDGIVALTGANNTFFVAVKNTDGDQFGENISGISAGTLTRNSTTGAPEFVLYNADGTANGTNAINSFPVNFTANLLGAFAYNVDAVVPDTQSVDMWYDTLLGSKAGEAGRLFVAVGIELNTINASAWSVGTFIVSQGAETLTLTATKCAAPSDSYNEIIATLNDGTVNLKTSKVRTMHTSTGLIYLILGGNDINNGPETLRLNQVYAMPLVYGNTEAAEGSDYSADGLPANPSIFVNGAYTTPCAFADTSNYLDHITTESAAACVGGFNLPDPSYSPATDATVIGLPVGGGTGTGASTQSFITDMYVDGDAVYVATNDPNGSPVAESGLFKSQAVFNNLGQIDHWTDWQLVVPYDMGDYNNGTGNGAVNFAAVDGYTGHVWVINNGSQAANVTQWTNSGPATTAPGLVYAVNQALNNQCYSVLDLNSSTTSFGAVDENNVTYFGGYETICSVPTGVRDVTATTLNGTYTSINNQNPDTDYDWNNNLQTVQLPSGSGAVISMGYSAWSPNNFGNGYPTPTFILFGCSGTAETPPALYAADSSGIIPLTNVTGVPIKIQSQGGNLYVLTRSATQDLIWTASRANTNAELNANFIVTATSGTGNLATAKRIYDFAISSTATATPCTWDTPPTGFEQLIALTSDGIYTTSCYINNNDDLYGLNGLGLTDTPADNAQTYAGWTRIVTPETQRWFTDYISSALYDRSPQTFWFSNLVLNNTLPKPVYNANVFYQMGRETVSNAGTTQLYDFAENPSNTVTFNGVTEFNQQTAPSIYSQFPVTARQFYNDGSRRFFIQKSPTDDTKYQVLVLPFNLYDYNITTNGKPTIQDTLVAESSAFYWMSPIGALGQLMMSTDQGLIALE